MNLSEMDRGKIIALWEEGYAKEEIARKLNVSRPTVIKWVRRYEEEGNVTNRGRPPKPKLINADRLEVMRAAYSDDPFTPTRHFAERFNCSMETVRKALQRNGIHHRSRCKVSKKLKSDGKSDKTTLRPEDWPPKHTTVMSTRQCFREPKGYNKVSEQEAQPGQSKALDTRTSLDSNASRDSREQDPLSRVIEQCRFCGEFSKDCVAVSDNMPYLASNKTTLVLNDSSVQLDFNNHSLPKTVCRDCDANLQEIADFVKVVKAAQGTLIKVAEERAEFAETREEFEVARAEERIDTETEALVIKTEYDSENEESEDEKEYKEGIIDSLTVGETVFIKNTVNYKRKLDTSTAKSKKLKTKNCKDSELMIDIKENVIKKEGQGSEVSDSDVKPSESELATSALVFGMAGDGTSEYQGHRSERLKEKKMQ